MTKYRKKPLVVIAYRWFKNGDHPEDFAHDRPGHENGVLRTFTGAQAKKMGWEGAFVRYFRHPEIPGTDICTECGKPMHEHGWLDYPNERAVCPGDWVVTEYDNSFPMKPDVFAEVYEKA